MENKTSYPVKKSFYISGHNTLTGIMAFLLFFIVAATQSHAQTYTACFNLNPTQICQGDAVTFTDCSGSIAGILHTDDGSTVRQLDATVPSVTYTYNTAGVFHPYQVVNDGASGNSTSPTQTITVVNSSSAPTFTIGTCAGNQVTITSTDNNYDVYNITWGDGNIGSVAPMGSVTYTYAASGTYPITVTGAFTSATCTSTPVSISVTTLNLLIAPVIDDLTVNSQQLSGSVMLRFSALSTQRYNIEQQIGGGGYVDSIALVQYQSGTQILTFTGLPTSVDPIYYRIYAYDDCGGAAYSEDIYSAVLSGTATNHQNNLSWFDYHTFLVGNFDHYDLFRDGSLIATGLTTNTYPDADPALVCQQTYQYQVVTYSTTGGSITGVAYSAYIPVTAISTDVPATIQNPNVTVISGQTRVVWDTPSGFTPVIYQIQRADNGGPYLTVGTSVPVSGMPYGEYFDASASTGSSTMCYQINYTDACNNTAAYSVNTCPVLLQMSTSTTDNTLTWNSYTGYYATGTLNYEVEVLDENGNVVRTIPTGMALTAVDPIDPSASILRYRVKVYPNATENIPFSYSNIVEVSFAPQLHIPTAFSPNADGQNDKFFVKGRYLKEFQMTIFNQWGQAIFVSNDAATGWDGTFNGENCVVDDYVWIVKAKDNKGEEFVEKGTVSLLR